MNSKSITPHSDGICMQIPHSETGSAIYSISHNKVTPLVYLRRPKWIKDDASWQAILDALEFKLPEGTVIQ